MPHGKTSVDEIATMPIGRRLSALPILMDGGMRWGIDGGGDGRRKRPRALLVGHVMMTRGPGED